MNEDEKLILYFFLALGAVIAGIVAFCLTPVTEKVAVSEVTWHWTIQLYEYQKCYENSWGREEYEYPDGKEHILGQWDGGYDSPFKNHTADRMNAVPNGAYDITEKIEKYDTKRVDDGDDDYHYEDIYRYRYYYYIDRWKPTNILMAGGHDKNPHEPDCEYDTYVNDPKLGDKKRGAGHEESYTAIGRAKGKTSNTTYVLTKDQWSDLTSDSYILVKRSRFGNKVKEMKFIEYGA